MATSEISYNPSAAVIQSVSTGLSNSSGLLTNDALTGKSGGQTLVGGTATGNSLTLSSTAHATKGSIIMGGSSYNEATETMSFVGALKSWGGSDMATVFAATGINLLATGQTVIMAAKSGKKFVPLAARLHLTARTGTIVVAPIIRIGAGGSFNTICPLFTMLVTVVDTLDVVPLVTTLAAVDVSATAISLDVQTAGTNASVLTASLYLQGLLI